MMRNIIGYKTWSDILKPGHLDLHGVCQDGEANVPIYQAKTTYFFYAHFWYLLWLLFHLFPHQTSVAPC